MNASVVGVVFWIFVAVCVVAAAIGDYKKRKLAMEPLRLAIEKGQVLDPKVVQQLMQEDRESEEVDPTHLRIGGIITAASGVGVALASFLVAQVAPWALYPMLGLAVIALCVGGGLILAGNALARGREERAARQRALQEPDT
jgi:Domain of unknown function (DUF6249)